MNVEILEERYEQDGSYFVKQGCNGRWNTAGCPAGGDPHLVRARARKQLIEDVQWHDKQSEKKADSVNV